MPLLLISESCHSASESVEVPVVKIRDGLVSGKIVATKEGDVDAFYGIPYAAPPVGELRFRKPLPPTPWNGTYSAQVKPTACLQTDLRFLKNITLDYTNSTEDCLYLNLWRPSGICPGTGPCKKKLPVVVFIYGGGFQWGDSGLFVYDAANFVSMSDVIFVSFNHRVSFFGYLTVEAPGVKGNLGFWDQLLALKWVQENVGYFGGDPKDVTLGGHSAGAISAGLHSVSPLSKGLFHRTILQSSSPLTLILGLSYTGPGRFLDMAVQLGCHDAEKDWEAEIVSILNCLKAVDANTVMDQVRSNTIDKQLFNPIFGDEFIPSDPFSEGSWKGFHVKETLLGITSNEGSFFLDNIHYVAPEFKDFATGDYRFGVALALFILLEVPVPVGKSIVNEYFGDHHVQHDLTSINQISSEIIGDVLVNCPVHFFADMTAKKGIRTYKYVFDHRPSYSLWPEWFRVAHADELTFTFGSLRFIADESRYTAPFSQSARKILKNIKYTPEEEDFMKQMVGIWSSFIKTG